jgi:hypothetical protein
LGVETTPAQEAKPRAKRVLPGLFSFQNFLSCCSVRRRVKDDLFRGRTVRRVARKRRLWCKPCGKPFTEPVPGIRKGFRHSERYGRAALGASECQRRVEVTGDRRSMAIRRLLLRTKDPATAPALARRRLSTP